MVGLFGLASLYAADRARQGQMDGSWLVAAGALAGSAAGVKYVGLYFVPAAAMLLVQRGPWTTTIRALAIFGAAACIALAPTYGRLLALTGNPLFPFYPSLFGGNAWEADEFLGARGIARLPRGFHVPLGRGVSASRRGRAATATRGLPGGRSRSEVSPAPCARLAPPS